MNRSHPFTRKIGYLAVLAALLLPLSWLSRPATIDPTGRGTNPGGLLAQKRDQFGLSQASLGEIDPASETMKLATLGMRGIAANILWSKANYYHKVKDFTNMSATLEQITKLQPNFISVWIFQGWNLSYNISVEFDDYRDRYHWVIRGIRFLEDGIHYNTNEPTLTHEVGRIISQKIGTADEKVQFRRLFVADDDFHGSRPAAERDNWLVGKQWLLDSVRKAQETKRRIKGSSPLIYLTDAPLCQMHYAEALQVDGVFDEPAREAWRQAAFEWNEYGNAEVPTATGKDVRLADLEYYTNLKAEKLAQLESLAPGVEAAIRAEKRAALSPEEQASLDKPIAELELSEGRVRLLAEEKVAVQPLEIVDRVDDPQKHPQAVRCAAEAMRATEIIHLIDTSRNIVNFGYWRMRCEAECTKDALDSHRLLYLAQQAQAEVELERAKELYEQGFRAWQAVLDKYPALLDDGITGGDLVAVIRRYERCLKQLDEELPKDFVLQKILDNHASPDLDAALSVEAGRE